MITLELTLVSHTTGCDEGKIFLTGDRFAVTSRYVRTGVKVREVTVINDGLCRHDGYFVEESYEDVRDMIANKLIARDAYVARSKVR